MSRSIPPQRIVIRKSFLWFLTLSLALVALLTVNSGWAFTPMPLGNYPDKSVQLSGNVTVTPDAAPVNTFSINVSSSTNFKGKLEADPTTGVVRVTDAHPAGVYSVTVTGFDIGGATTKTFSLTVTTPLTCNPVTFANATNFGAGTGLRSVAVGDFNGDGKQDLATANFSSNNMSVLLGDGLGSFAAATNFTVGSAPFSVVVGDFNGDGKEDLATANFSSNNMSVLLGDGAGAFSAATSFGVGTGPTSVAVGDFNGDGKQDVATANLSSNNMSVLLGDGAGSFSVANSFTVGSGPYSVVVGDFNGDGKQDLATANQNSNNVSVLLGNGAGSFAVATNFTVGSVPVTMAVGDFNGDGKQDLAVPNFSSSNISILLGNGAGIFGTATNFAIGSQPQAVAVGDFNGDGIQDLAAASSSNNVSTLLGNGTGSFGPVATFAVGSFPRLLAVGDFNGDGKQDFATANFTSNNVSVLLRQCPSSLLVTNTNDSGAGSLRQAIIDSNNTPGPQAIGFNIPGAGVHTITPTSLLPDITDPVAIDGYTQPGASPNTLAVGNDALPLIEINGANAIPPITAFDGLLTITAGNSTVRGLVLNRFIPPNLNIIAGWAISLRTSGSNVVEGCFIGIDPTGTIERHNQVAGVLVDSQNNLIGGTTPAARNVIADGIDVRKPNNQIKGNYLGTNAAATASFNIFKEGVGISNTQDIIVGGPTVAERNVISANTGISVSNSANVTIQGNYIGTNAGGNAGIALGSGIALGNATNITIGGLTAIPGTGPGNLISGNPGTGISWDTDNGSSALTIRGNLIGTNAAGTAAVANGTGIQLLRGTGAVIGGTDPQARNVISGNISAGGHALALGVGGTPEDGAIVQGNYIGVAIDGTTVLGNGVGGNGSSVYIFGSNNLIGGTVAGAANILAGASRSNVEIAGGIGNAIRGNSIFGAAFVGIDLGPAGVTPNDVGDADTGVNNLQNFPVLTSAISSGSNTIVQGTLNSTASSSFNIEFFANSACDSSGNGEGKRFLGSTNVDTDGEGNASFSSTLPSSTSPGDEFVTATATDPTGNTSEFSACVATSLTTIEVSNTNDSGAGSLRQAITGSNILTGVQTIVFNIPGPGVHTINLATALPTITQPVIIDGYTQPGASANTLTVGNNAVLLIELNGAGTGFGTNGLVITAGNTTLRGLVINRFPNDGIILDTGDGNIIEGNFIGTTPAGNAASANQNNGVFVNAISANNLIGGITPQARNVISGNLGRGVGFSGSGTNNNTVQGNYIGVNAAGTTAIADGVGIDISLNSQGNTIGGTTAAARNIISGSADNIILFNAGAINNTIQGNYIGTDANGTAAVDNTSIGIYISSGASSNTIGGTADGAGNVISGNSVGIFITDSPTTNISVLGNRIGTTAAGDAALPNTFGVLINDSDNNTIGGTTAGAGNIIANNTSVGVDIPSGVGNKVLSNSIFANGGLGIDLNGDGVTPNDAGDADGGANDLQNFPVLSSASSAGGSTTVQGTLNSSPDTAGIRIEFFSSASCHPAGNGEGRTFLGATTIGTSGTGNATINETLPVATTPGEVITATATDPAGNTSEFSACVTIGGQPSLTVTNTNDSGAGSLRQAILDSNANAGTQTITFNIGGGGPQTISPLSALPPITDPVVIDGYTQPGSSANTLAVGDNAVLLVELNGTNAGAGANGLVIMAGNTTVQGLVINRFGQNGIILNINGGNTIAGNYIGTTTAGTVASANIGSGILIIGVANNLIGGTTAAARNLISGNMNVGVFIRLAGASGNLVQGNYIGTDASGNSALGNRNDAVFLDNAPNNQIGGTTDGARNILSATTNANGLELAGAGATGNIALGNYIGTNANGTAALPNGDVGVYIQNGAANNQIGNALPGARNVISGNNNHGVYVSGAGTGNIIAGNFIGADAAGTSALGNTGQGIRVQSGGTVVGGASVGQANVIAFNGGNGVQVASGTGSPIRQNAIFANTGLGIDLGSDGVTANDAGDADTGANNLQNFPVLTAANSTGSNTVVLGTLNSTANTLFTIEFFANPSCDSSGNGEGQVFLGSTHVTTDGGGNTSFNPTIGNAAGGQVITATATDPDGNTSEFSACRQVTTATFSISGRVRDNSGNALANAVVSLSGSATAGTTTDAGGNYSFANLAAGGNYTVTPSSSDYAFDPASQTFNNLNINRIANFVAMRTMVNISGKVTDSNNVGIANVEVALGINGAPGPTHLTDALGNYSFSDLNAGANFAVTPAGSFTPSSQTFNNLTVNAVANFKATPSIPSQCNTMSFAAATNFAAGSSIRSLAIGDFNNDGESDLATANGTSANVSILLGSGTGSFSAATNFAVGAVPESVAIGDFNGDGNSDLAVTNQDDDNVSILLGSGTGSFSAATNFTAASRPVSVAVGDFNDDGRSDLTVANGDSANVSILLGSGTGSFGAATNFAVGAIPVFVAIGDFNGDGISDLAVANSNSNNVSILLGSGTGSFSAATNFAVGAGPRSVAIGDFNGDSKHDLAVANQGSDNVSILLGDGAGNFSAATDFAVGSFPEFVAIGDVNGDGKLDLAVANGLSGNVSILLGSGTGSFGSAANFAVGSIPFSVAIGDFNGDGKSDLAVANQNDNNISILLNNGAICNTLSSLTISGQVKDAQNNPLADVTVTLSGTVTRVVQSDFNGNYSFSGLTPGGNYSVTTQSPYFVFQSSRSDFFNLSSNQTPSFVAAPVVVPSPTPPLSDNFNSPVRDANKWNLGTLTLSPDALDPRVTTAQINGQLVVTPLNQASGLHYNGYVSANSFDLRNGSTSVEVVKAASGGGETIFGIGSDVDNFYRFVVQTPGSTSVAPLLKGPDGIERPLDVTTAQLIFQVKIGGVLTSLSINYDPVQHRFMRFRHEPLTNSIVFETSPDGINFTVQNRVVLQKGVSALTAELSAGTSSPTNPGQAVFDNYGLVTSTFQFNSGSYTVGESEGSVLVTVTRTGSTAEAASVSYSTTDGTASQTNKYISAVGTLSFAPGESSRTFTVLIVDTALTEGNQTLNVLLSNPIGSGLNSPGRAIVTINDNDTVVPTANPLDDPAFFVNQQYFDFLNRVPDDSGRAFWTNQITSCGTDIACIEIRRINVSAAFFISIEFQETGYLVYRIYQAAYGNISPTVPVPVRYGEFLPDTQQIGLGVVVGQPGFEQQLENNKVAFTLAFVTRPRFTEVYPTTMTPAQFVDALYLNAGVTPSEAERASVIGEFSTPDTTADTAARGRVLRRVAENATLNKQEFNRAFVLMQYFGYLRRNPNDAPDTNFDGYNFWLNKLNEFNGNFVSAEMVKAFIVSGEYRHRFGP